MRQEMRFACRALLRSRGYAGAAVITLALGLGVNIAVATVAWSVLLRPLPIADSDRVVLVYPASPSIERLRQPISYPRYLEWRARNSVFQELAVTTPLTIQLADARGEDIAAAAVSDNFLTTLGAPPAQGRLLAAADRSGSAGAVACVVSAAFARRISGATPAINRRLEALDPDRPNLRLSLLIVGVMPEGFERWRDRVDVWIPVEAPGILGREQISSPGYHTFFAVGRLRPGVTAAQAHAAITQLDRDVERELEGVPLAPPPLRVVSVRDDIVPAGLQRTLVLFSIAAALVLAIAVANASSLVLARLEARHAEVSIRAAIGASGADLFRYVLAETTVLAAAGAGAGVPLAYWSLRLLGALAPAGISGQPVGFSATLGAYTVLLTIGVAVALAALQRFAIRRATADPAMRTGTPAATPASSPVLDLLVAGEVALAVVVVVAGVLLLRSFVHLLYTDPGFRPEGVLVANLDVESTSASTAPAARDQRVALLIKEVQDRAASVPGVDVAAVGRRAPLEAFALARTSILRDDGARFLNGGPDFEKAPDLHRVGAGYFEALGIPLRAGRAFTDKDDPSRRVVIVNETMARTHWPGLSPIGRRLKYTNTNPSAPWAEVIGVVGDVRSRSLHDPPRSEIYAPLSQLSDLGGALRLFVRTRHDPAALAPAVFTVFQDLSPRLRVLRLQPLDDVVRLSISDQEYQSDLLGGFAALSLLLAAAGVYGLLSYRITRRRREMAIRIAVGAAPREVLLLVLRRSAWLVGPGLVAGVAAALAATRVLRSVLFGISTTDPLTFTLVPALFIVVAAMASLAPARRALSADVAVALREE